MDPKYEINPSTVLAVIKTGASLLAFATLFFGTVMRFLSARDVAGLFVYLQQNDTIAGLTMLATAGWFVWRSLAAMWKKRRDVEIANAAPDSVAVVK